VGIEGFLNLQRVRSPSRQPDKMCRKCEGNYVMAFESNRTCHLHLLVMRVDEIGFATAKEG
jgi:hypothetical protein